MIPDLSRSLLIGFAVAWIAPAPRAQETRPAPVVLGVAPDPSREPLAAERLPMRVAARAVRVAYVGARDAPATVVRSREEARSLAGAVAVLARSRDGDFDALVRDWTDEPDGAAHGGFLGTIRPRKAATALERALFGVRIGGVIGPLDMPEGFIVAQRVPLEELAYEAVLFPWNGADKARPDAPSKEEAQRAASQLVERIAADPAAFAAANPSGVGPIPRGELELGLENALLGSSGAVLGPIETRRGWMVVRRLPVEWVTIDTLLVAFRGARDAPLTQVRTREDSKARAEELLKRARAAGNRFGPIAEQSSDDPADRQRDGRRTFAVGPKSGILARAAARLPFDEWTVVESEYGFHVVRRVALEPD